MRGRLHDRPVIEWIFGAVSAAIVTALMLFLLWRAFAPGAGEIRLAAVLERVDRLADGIAVQVLVVNAGSEAVADVVVQAVAADESFAPRQFTLEHIAADSVRRGVFLLPAGTRGEAVRLEVASYVIP